VLGDPQEVLSDAIQPPPVTLIHAAYTELYAAGALECSVIPAALAVPVQPNSPADDIKAIDDVDLEGSDASDVSDCTHEVVHVCVCMCVCVLRVACGVCATAVTCVSCRAHA